MWDWGEREECDENIIGEPRWRGYGSLLCYCNFNVSL